MKVVEIFNSRLQKHGSFEDFMIFLSRKARARGWQTSFIFPGINTIEVKYLLEQEGSDTYEVKADWNTVKSKWQMMKLLYKIRPQIANFHFCSSLSFIWIFIYCRLSRIKVVYHYHGEILPLEKIPRMNKHLSRLRLLTLFASRIVAVSKANATFLRALNIKKQIDVVYNGIDVSVFSSRVNRSSDKGSLYRKSQEAQCNLIYIGSLIPRKQVDVLIKAFSIARDDFPNAKLTVVGSGFKEAEYKKLAEDLNLSGSIVFAGLLKDYPFDILARSDIFVSASEAESFGLVFAEAMCLGIPVVACRVGGVPEVVEDGRTGIIVPPYNPKAMAEAIKVFLNDEDLRKRMGEAGKKRVREMFDLSDRVEELFSIFGGLR